MSHNTTKGRLDALEAQQAPDARFVSFPSAIWDAMTPDEQAAASAGVKVYLDLSPDQWDADDGHSVLTPCPPEGPPEGARTLTLKEMRAAEQRGESILIEVNDASTNIATAWSVGTDRPQATHFHKMH